MRPVITKTRSKFVTAAAVTALSFFISASSQAKELYEYLNLGNAASTTAHDWAIFTLGTPISGGLSALSSFSGTNNITGSIGAAGKANYSLSAGTTVSRLYAPQQGTDGELVYHTGGSVKPASPAGVSGGVVSNTSMDSILDSGAASAKNVADTAKNLTGSGLTFAPGSMTINAVNSGADNYVFNLSDLILSNYVLTLNGTSTQSYVFNISGTFKLTKTSILLSGGLTADNVLFNYTGGSDIVINNVGATPSTYTVNGIILAATTASPTNPVSAPTGNSDRSSILLTGGTLNGQLIANKVTVGNATINTVVSP